ncbi:MAG TPA: helix-turn-helix domain-containing protein [Acidimicrobiales bacterium]|nr:helix-turn-helix domain-containing protein [Acidimicrobiales bacterium]
MTIDKSTEKSKNGTRARRRRGDDTRRKVEVAAGRLFTERGYQATTMQVIADEAGVHVQTIYLAYGTKAAVLAAAATRLVAGDDDPDSHPSQRRWAREIMAADDPVEKVRLYVRHVREVTPRILRLVDVLRATAPSDPDVASFLAHMQEGRREGPYALLAPLADAGQLRAGLTRASAADITYALASADTFRALVDDRGWSWPRAERWIAGQLRHALLSDDVGPADRS